MNDSYVISRLNAWAEWSIRRQDSGLGYPKSVSFTNQMPKGGFGAITPDIAEECFEVERCVMALAYVNRDLYTVIDLSYRRTLTCDQRCKEAGCVKSTFYLKLGRAHQMVLGYLNDIAAGMEIPSASNTQKKRTA
jgi:hypothetical protein